MVDRQTGRMKVVDSSKFGRFEEVANGVGYVHLFGNVGAAYGGGGLMVVDTSNFSSARLAVMAIRAQTDEPLEAIVYTHGHTDHVGGATAFLAECEERGAPSPVIWGHENIPRRFERYRDSWGWNNEINSRQFGFSVKAKVFPQDFVEPTQMYSESAEFQLAGETVELYHAHAETDDATWVWMPDRKVAFVGDLLIHSMPNAGNPNKIQRNVIGWAEGLEAVAAKNPDHLILGHLQPVSGDLALETLQETARALRWIHDAVLDRLNSGIWPDAILEEKLELPPDLAGREYLQPLYGCCDFVVRDVIYRYCGWWGGDPTELFPIAKSTFAQDLLQCVDRDKLVEQIETLCDAGEHQRALSLANTLYLENRNDSKSRKLLAKILDELAQSCPSFIGRNLYAVEATNIRRNGG